MAMAMLRHDKKCFSLLISNLARSSFLLAEEIAPQGACSQSAQMEYSEQPDEECQEHSKDHKGEDGCCFKATKFKYNPRVTSSRRNPTPNHPTQQNNLPTTSPPSFMEKFRKNFKQKHPANKYYVIVRMEIREK